MKARNAILSWNTLLSSLLGLVALLLAAPVLAGWQVPWIGGERGAFIALWAIGFGMCVGGMGRVVARLGWTHPVTLIGIALGILVLLLAVGVLAGWGVPLLPNLRGAFTAAVAVIAIKWVLARASILLLKA